MNYERKNAMGYSINFVRCRVAIYDTACFLAGSAWRGMMRPIKLAEGIAMLLFYLFLIWLLYQIVLKLTGHSPTIETILSTAMVTIISYLLVTTLKIAEFMGETKEFMSTAKNSFGMIKNDMASLKNDMTILKEEIQKIRKK